MSDAPRGPGWWLASDGRWYPPETHPQRMLPPPPPSTPPAPPGPPVAPYPPYPITPGWPAQPTHGATAPYGYAPQAVQVGRAAPSSGLNGTIQGFLWAAAGLSAITAVMALVAMAGFNTYWDMPLRSRGEARAYEDWIALDDAYSGAAGLTLLCGVVAGILLMIWMNQAHKATQQWWYGPRRWSSGWTVGGWFVPVANALIPKMVLTEIEKLALAPHPAGQADPAWQQRKALAIGNVWWVLLVVGWIVMTIGDAIGGQAGTTAGDVRTGYLLNALAFTLLTVSGVLGALYLRRLNRAFHSPRAW